MSTLPAIWYLKSDIMNVYRKQMLKTDKKQILVYFDFRLTCTIAMIYVDSKLLLGDI